MAIATLHALTDNIISAKRKQLNGHIKEDENPEGTRKPALLDVLMQCEINGKHLTDQEIKDHVNTFLFAVGKVIFCIECNDGKFEQGYSFNCFNISFKYYRY